MNINILHVSDLHRDPFSPISNLTLLDSLKRDRDQHASPDDLGISSLDLIVVNGDIIQGVRHGCGDAEAVLQRQYEEALEFLEGTDRPVRRRRQRICDHSSRKSRCKRHTTFGKAWSASKFLAAAPKDWLGHCSEDNRI